MNKDNDLLSLKKEADSEVEKIISEVNQAKSASSKDDIINKINQSLAEREEYEYPQKDNTQKSNTYKSYEDSEEDSQEAIDVSDYRHDGAAVKSNKGKTVALFITGLIIILLVSAYIVGYLMTNDAFLPNTYVNGINVSGLNIDEAAVAVNDNSQASKLVLLKNDGSTVTIDYSKIDYSYSTETELKKLLDSENKYLWFLSLVKKTKETINVEGSYSEEKLKDIIENASFGVTPSTNAKIDLTDNGFVIVPEVQGNIVDTEKVFEAAKEAINNGAETVDLSAADCYKKPKVVSSDLTDKLEKLNKVFNITIKLDFDYTTEDITYEVFKDWVEIKKDGTYTVDEDKVYEWVNSLRSKYDTLHKTRKFKSTLQGTIKIKAQKDYFGQYDGIFGYYLDADETAKAITKALETGKDKTIDPIYYTSGGYTYDTAGMAKRSKGDEKEVINDLKNIKTYIEVDLTNQKLWYYKNGKVKMKCDIVSGLPTAERMTYPGIYQLWMKETNKTMKGQTTDGSYESKCSYWNYISVRSIGIHDATWQAAFGGDRYKTYGSHGCVGISLSDAQYIYENVPLDTVVIMYY